MENKVIRKWFWVWDFEKEEDWLNEMALSGWMLDGVGFCRFTFVPCQPGEVQIRLVVPDDDRAEYVSFVESTGAKYIGKMVYWYYFRKSCEEGEFQLLGDLDSKVAHLKRIERILFLVMLLNLVIGMNVNVQTSRINLLCAVLLAYGLGRLMGVRSVLEKERNVHE